MKKGYIHIYTGDGKGKTTAALGLALRAAGRGLETYIGQFMKGQFYGELKSLELIPQIVIEQYGDPGCFTKDQVTRKHISQAEKGLKTFIGRMNQQKYDIMIMDEICVAVWFGLIHEDKVIEVMLSKPEPVELILTGRKASARLMEHADLVTEMREEKHYYKTLGILSRPGIEN